MNIWIVIGGIFLIEATLIFGLLYIRSLLLPPSLETYSEVLDDRWSRYFNDHVTWDDRKDRGNG